MVCECGYSLGGLPQRDGMLTCPECGAETRVADAAVWRPGAWAVLLPLCPWVGLLVLVLAAAKQPERSGYHTMLGIPVAAAASVMLLLVLRCLPPAWRSRWYGPAILVWLVGGSAMGAVASGMSVLVLSAGC